MALGAIKVNDGEVITGWPELSPSLMCVKYARGEKEALDQVQPIIKGECPQVTQVKLDTQEIEILYAHVV